LRRIVGAKQREKRKEMEPSQTRRLKAGRIEWTAVKR
jgi:hypothetical protein